MRRLRKTKIIATIGPASESVDTLAEMIRAGMNVARLNCSHGTMEEHERRLERIREASERVGAPIATMVDTKGIKIRTGRIGSGRVELQRGARFELRSDGRPGDASGVSVSYPGLAGEVGPGDAILLDDGAIELVVEKAREGSIVCEVKRGGTLGSQKGVNLPHTQLPLSAMSPETRQDLIFAAERGADYVAASFVQNPDDITKIRGLLEAHGSEIPIIAKIENRSAVENLSAIVASADGTMVARGDLGVELPVEEVPMIQKKIIRTTVLNGKPVVTATQMLDSMERNLRPTRAEVSDVANAILDGTSAVMLAGETAVGKHPVEAVRTMAVLASQAEASLEEYGHLQKILSHPSHVVTEAVSQAAITMANHLEAAAIFTLTETGFTSRSISKYRPACPIVALTDSLAVVRKLSMNWGVTPIYCEDAQDSDQAKVEFGLRRARELGYLRSGDVVVVTAGQHQQTGSTNLIRVVQVE